MSDSYRIATLSDLLKVPVERRADMFRDLEYALAFHELVHGAEALATEFGPLTWTDDGNHSVTVSDDQGPWLSLEVTDEP